MLRRLIPTVLPVLALLIGTARLNAAEDMPALADLPPSLKAGVPEAALPTGAVVHVRISGLMPLLAALNDAAVPFVPREAVPAEWKAHLQAPQPLLSLLGEEMAGKPLTPASFASDLGLASDRPLTLSLYAGDPESSWVLALPIADEAALGQLVMNLLRPRRCEPIEIGAGPRGEGARSRGWHIVGTNQSLPRDCLALRSPDTLYLFGGMAPATLALGNGVRLDADPIIAAMPPGELAVALSTSPLKPFVGMLAKQFGEIPPRSIARMRRNLLRGIPPEAIANLNLQLRLRLGIASVDQALDYVECLLTASAETMVPALAKTLMGIDGAAFSVRMSADQARLQVAVLAEGIEQLLPAPMPLAEVRAALAALPGDRLVVSASGRTPRAQPSALAAAWLASLGQKLEAKQLDGGLLVALATYWRDRKPALELGSEVPWALTADCSPSPRPAEARSLEAYIAGFQLQHLAVPGLIAFPTQGEAFLTRHLTARAEVANGNDSLFARLMHDAGQSERWIRPVARFRAEPRQGKPVKLVFEDAYVTRSGLFGYSQHELVNRTIWYSADRGGLTLMQRVDGDGASWLDEPAPPARALPPALGHLLDLVEEGSATAEMARLLPLLPRILEEGTRLEQAARTEIDDYLAKAVQVIDANRGDQQQMMQALVALPMPLMVASLNVDEDQELYCMLPGNLRYPRPAVMPVVARLFAGVTAQAEALGGMVATSKAAPGRCTFTVVQDLRGAALLVRSTGDVLWREFLGRPDPAAAVMQAIGAPHDGERVDHEQVVVYNLVWPRGR